MDLLKKPTGPGFGIMDIVPGAFLLNQLEVHINQTRILLMDSGGGLNLDFMDFSCTGDELFFIGAGQHLQIADHSSAVMLYYDDDLYFSDAADHYRTWKGILFNGELDRPGVALWGDAKRTILSFFGEIRKEIEKPCLNHQAMTSALIKQLIVTSMRLSNSAQGGFHIHYGPGSDFFRHFHSLVDEHFRTMHAAVDYAKICKVSTKTLNKKVFKYCNKNPSDIIYKRIVLEAKRMLVQTQMSVQDIAYVLGYDDYSYFIRFFVKHAGVPPQTFRRCHNPWLTAVA
jgi:AraC-like DNA-binding protein